jgi:hypothetical protein
MEHLEIDDIVRSCQSIPKSNRFSELSTVGKKSIYQRVARYLERNVQIPNGAASS